MIYRLGKDSLLEKLGAWNAFLKKKVHLIAAGGTALTLFDIKPSTKDIDLIVPKLNEYEYLVGVLKELGYRPATGWGLRAETVLSLIFSGEIESIQPSYWVHRLSKATIY